MTRRETAESPGLRLPTLSERIGRVLALDPSAPAVEFERHWHTWGELAASADAAAPHVRPGERVALLLRNRPPQLGLLLGLLRAGACVIAVNPGRGVERNARLSSRPAAVRHAEERGGRVHQDRRQGVRRLGVRANCVCPGAIETGSLAALRGALARERGVPPAGLLEQVMVDEWHMDVALRRPGTPGEVGDLFAFLLSPRAGYLTGAVINIDGGTQF
ncbi:SDR family oxidoreductase [Parafrankia sp. FMc6]|uniref:SDR family oxidoreductase n=1 Tax=Parafrankia soli TaxID=2599596 RepID=UPI0034D47063